MVHQVDHAGSLSDTDVESPPAVRQSGAMKRTNQARACLPSDNESDQQGRSESQSKGDKCVRVRRRLAELPNRVACLLCPKSYGSDTAMLHHMRLKHSLSAAAARQSFLARKIKENYGKPHTGNIVVDDKHLVAQHIMTPPASGTLEPPNDRASVWARANQLSPPAHHHAYAPGHTPTHPFAASIMRQGSHGHSPDTTWTPRVPYTHSPHHNEPSAVYRSVSGGSVGYVPQTPDDHSGYSSFVFATGPAIPYPETSSSSSQANSWTAHRQAETAPYAHGAKYAHYGPSTPHAAQVAPHPFERQETLVDVKSVVSENSADGQAAGSGENRTQNATPESGHGQIVDTTSTVDTVQLQTDEIKKGQTFSSRFSIASLLACEGP